MRMRAQLLKFLGQLILKDLTPPPKYLFADQVLYPL